MDNKKLKNVISEFMTNRYMFSCASLIFGGEQDNAVWTMSHNELISLIKNGVIEKRGLFRYGESSVCVINTDIGILVYDLRITKFDGYFKCETTTHNFIPENELDPQLTSKGIQREFIYGLYENNEFKLMTIDEPKLFLVTRDDSVGWDEYNSILVACRDITDARKTAVTYESLDYCNIVVEEIGTYNKPIDHPEVPIESFNNG